MPREKILATPGFFVVVVKLIFIIPISYTLGASLHATKKSIEHMGLCKMSSSRGMRNVNPGTFRLVALYFNHYATPGLLKTKINLNYT